MTCDWPQSTVETWNLHVPGVVALLQICLPEQPGAPGPLAAGCLQEVQGVAAVWLACPARTSGLILIVCL